MSYDLTQSNSDNDNGKSIEELEVDVMLDCIASDAPKKRKFDDENNNIQNKKPKNKQVNSNNDDNNNNDNNNNNNNNNFFDYIPIENKKNSYDDNSDSTDIENQNNNNNRPLFDDSNTSNNNDDDDDNNNPVNNFDYTESFNDDESSSSNEEKENEVYLQGIKKDQDKIKKVVRTYEKNTSKQNQKIINESFNNYQKALNEIQTAEDENKITEQEKIMWLKGLKSVTISPHMIKEIKDSCNSLSFVNKNPYPSNIFESLILGDDNTNENKTVFDTVESRTKCFGCMNRLFVDNIIDDNKKHSNKTNKVGGGGGGSDKERIFIDFKSKLEEEYIKSLTLNHLINFYFDVLDITRNVAYDVGLFKNYVKFPWTLKTVICHFTKHTNIELFDLKKEKETFAILFEVNKNSTIKIQVTHLTKPSNIQNLHLKIDEKSIAIMKILREMKQKNRLEIFKYTEKLIEATKKNIPVIFRQNNVPIDIEKNLQKEFSMDYNNIDLNNLNNLNNF